jgi:hypothetical protein
MAVQLTDVKPLGLDTRFAIGKAEILWLRNQYLFQVNCPLKSNPLSIR